MKIEPFIEPDEIEKAYAAGFLDGEGCFGVVHYQSRKLMADGSERAPGCRVQVYVGQDNKAPLEFLAYRWGGTLHENIEPTGHKFYRLNFARAVAVKLCEDLLPYLIVKRSSAQHLCWPLTQSFQKAGTAAHLSKSRHSKPRS